MALSSQRQDAPTLNTLPPELQQEILNYLDGDNASLFAAIQVSKAFHNFCIGMLWRNSTSRRLAKPLTLERRQHYANMIRSWDLNDYSSGELFDGLNFPLLGCVSFSYGDFPIKQLRHCLQNGLHVLQELRMICPEADHIKPDQFVTFLQSFPALYRLDLDRIKRHILSAVFRWKSSSLAQLKDLTLIEHPEAEWFVDPNPWLFSDFLQRCTGLRKLRVAPGHVLSAEVLTQLSCQESLEVLRIHGYISREVGVQLRDRFSSRLSRAHLFPSIQRLHMAGESPMINTLLSGALVTLIDLELEVDDSFDSICPTIGRLSNLVSLHISFEKHRELSQQDMDHISDLSKLEQCHIGRFLDCLEDPMEDPWLTDLYFKKWIMKLPRLRSLRLELNSPTITQAALQSLADSCPSIASCQLIWEHDLSTWTELVPPLFGNLKSLHLGWVRGHGGGEDQAVTDDIIIRNVKVVRSIAPKLKHLAVESRRQHEMALVDAFRSGI
ncbi:hypothetical protein KCU71_g13384, partial [Aureobasidium melanogenum]